jgi:hypothetical protein
MDKDELKHIGRKLRRIELFEDHFKSKQLPEDIELAVKILYFHNSSWLSSLHKEDLIKRSRATGLKKTLNNLIKDMPEIFNKEEIQFRTSVGSALNSMVAVSRKFSHNHQYLIRSKLR